MKLIFLPLMLIFAAKISLVTSFEPLVPHNKGLDECLCPPSILFEKMFNLFNVTAHREPAF